MNTRSSNSSASTQKSEEEDSEEDDGFVAYYSKKKDAYSSLPKNEVLSFARNLIANHRMDEARNLLKNFLLDKRMPPIFMSKFAMLVFDHFQTDDFNTMYIKYLTPFLNKMSNLDVDKRDLLLELISLITLNGEQDLIQEFSTDRQVWNSSHKMNRASLRKGIVSMKSLYKCYVSYLQYWIWDDTKHIGDTSPKANYIVDSVTEHLLTEDKTCLDFMALCVARIFIYYDNIQGGVEFYTDYAEKHVNNLSAQLQLYHLLELQLIEIHDEIRTQDGQLLTIAQEAASVNHSLRLDCYQRIRNLDQSNPLVLSICSSIPENQDELIRSICDSVKDLMAYLDYGTNKSDISCWNTLVQDLKSLLLHNRKDFDEVKEHYLENYHEYWIFYHFNLENLEKGLERPKILFCSMMGVCDNFVDQVIEFLDGGSGLNLSAEVESLTRLRDS